MLTDAHRADLRRSGLNDATIALAGCYSADASEVHGLLKLSAVGPGLVFPYFHTTNGNGPPLVRVRPDRPYVIEGKAVKYLVPLGSTNRLYLPPTATLARLRDPILSLVITEGEKKALKAAEVGLLCVALGGVYNWLTKTADDTSVPISDLDLIAWRNRQVSIIFDTDPKTTTLENVRLAEARLAAELTRRGARVFGLRLPLAPDGTKGALDDFLAVHTLDDLQAVPSVPLPDPASVAFPLYDGAEVWDFPTIVPLVDALLPAVGIVWWGGMPKRFKSLLALYVSLAIACRRETVCGRFGIHGTPPILYVSREDSGGRLQERRDDILAAWEGTRPAPEAIRFAIRPRLDLLNPAHITWLRETCLAHGIQMLVLDTWTALSPSADPSGTQDQTALAAAVVKLGEDIGGTILVVDHSRKNRPEGQPLSSADIFGPAQKWAAAEHIVMLDVVKAGQRIEVFVEGKDAETQRFFLAVSPKGSGREKFTFAGDVGELAEAQTVKGDHHRDQVLDALTAAHEALTTGQVVLALAEGGVIMDRSTVWRHLQALVKTYQVTRIGSGNQSRYVVMLVRSGPSATDAGAT